LRTNSGTDKMGYPDSRRKWNGSLPPPETAVFDPIDRHLRRVKVGTGGVEIRIINHSTCLSVEVEK
jgi:hypothetical protein